MAAARELPNIQALKPVTAKKIISAIDEIRAQ
jgi:hypothetical protein